ncbi:hypothetical protein DFH09DRAFT_1354723 [Mycena vulgaris]|nr:hypothetical protein DFH09DRAFT_1354723 [Mycena vulgaris]
MSNDQRIKVLVPVREYIAHITPPSDALKFAVRQHFHRVLGLWDRNILAEGIASQFSLNFKNLNSILQDALGARTADGLDNLKSSIIILTRFSQISGRPASRLTDQVSQQISAWQNDPIYGRYLIEKFKSALFVPIEDPDSFRQWYNALGHFFGHRNQTMKALDYHYRALPLVETIGVPNFEELAALRGLAEILSRTGQYVAGEANAYRAERYAELLGDSLAEAECAGIRARCYYSLGNLREALNLGLCRLASIPGDILAAQSMFEESFSQLRSIAPEEATFCMEKLVGISSQMGNVQDCSRWAGVYLAFSSKLGNKLETLKAHRCMGDIFVREGDDATALSIFQATLETFTAMDVHQCRGDCMARMAEIFEQLGNIDEATQIVSYDHGYPCLL